MVETHHHIHALFGTHFTFNIWYSLWHNLSESLARIITERVEATGSIDSHNDNDKIDGNQGLASSRTIGCRYYWPQLIKDIKYLEQQNSVYLSNRDDHSGLVKASETFISLLGTIKRHMLDQLPDSSEESSIGQTTRDKSTPCLDWVTKLESPISANQLSSSFTSSEFYFHSH